jgi:hypothetical protein
MPRNNLIHRSLYKILSVSVHTTAADLAIQAETEGWLRRQQIRDLNCGGRECCPLDKEQEP